MDFDKAIETVLLKVGGAGQFVLKEQQREALRLLYTDDDRKLLIKLPTGYGKSLISQLTPFLLGLKRGITKPVVLVISPLTVLQKDQMRGASKLNVRSCRLNYKGHADAFACASDDDDEESFGEIEVDQELGNIKRGDFPLIYCHPEALFNTQAGQELLVDSKFASLVVAVAYDECHKVKEWGSKFRKAFEQVKDLAAFFPSAAFYAMSATVTMKDEKDLVKLLEFHQYRTISETPDRENIRLVRIMKDSSSDVKAVYEELYSAELERLSQDPSHYPVTLMYMPLDYLAQAAAFAKGVFPDTFNIYDSYWAVIYSNLDSETSTEITKQLKLENPRIRLVFCTSVLGMGFDAPAVTQVIHVKPPRRMNDYLQEIGRAGRSMQQSEAILYCNRRDIAANIQGMEDEMRDYCQTNTCLRKQLLAPYGFAPKGELPSQNCCSVCQCNPTATAEA